MSRAPAAGERLVLLGAEHRLFDHVTLVAAADGRTALAISPGALPEPRFWATKGNRQFPNEDACCALESGDATVLAVADAHFGRESSHVFITAIAAAPPACEASSFAELRRRLAALPPLENCQTASTLVVAVVDRVQGRVQALGFGDSRLCVLGPSGARSLLAPDHDFVRPGEREPLLDGREPQSFPVARGELVVAYSDGLCDAFGEGIGLAPDALAELAAAGGFDPRHFARAAAEAALAEPSPGAASGRDNLAIAVTRV